MTDALRSFPRTRKFPAVPNFACARNDLGPRLRADERVQSRPSLASCLQPPSARPRRITYSCLAPSLPAFAPWALASTLGYLTEAGYDVEFVVARRGVDVASRSGVVRADRRRDRRHAGDRPGNDVPVKFVGLIGRGAMTVVVGRKDRGIESSRSQGQEGVGAVVPGPPRAARALASKGITKNDINAQVGPAAVRASWSPARSMSCACTSDCEVDVPEAVKDAVSMPTKDYFQSMSQAILTSDKMIAERPTWCVPSSRRPCAA